MQPDRLGPLKEASTATAETIATVDTDTISGDGPNSVGVIGRGPVGRIAPPQPRSSETRGSRDQDPEEEERGPWAWCF